MGLTVGSITHLLAKLINGMFERINRCTQAFFIGLLQSFGITLQNFITQLLELQLQFVFLLIKGLKLTLVTRLALFHRGVQALETHFCFA